MKNKEQINTNSEPSIKETINHVIDELDQGKIRVAEKIDGMVFNPLSNRWKVSQDCAVNYIIKFKKN